MGFCLVLRRGKGLRLVFVFLVVGGGGGATGC